MGAMRQMSRELDWHFLSSLEWRQAPFMIDPIIPGRVINSFHSKMIWSHTPISIRGG
jgi:hypothetical protein